MRGICRVCRKDLKRVWAAAGTGDPPRLPGVEDPSPEATPLAGLAQPPPGAAYAQLSVTPTDSAVFLE